VPPDGSLQRLRCVPLRGAQIIAGNNQRFRVLDVVLFEEEDESPFVGAATGWGRLGLRTEEVERVTVEDGFGVGTAAAADLPVGPQILMNEGRGGV
jgi:hypothetical protein